MDYAIVIVLTAIMCSLIYIVISGKSHDFWTGGKVRRAILYKYMDMKGMLHSDR